MQTATEESDSEVRCRSPLSVVIPTYNSRSITLACLESLARASLESPGALELLVVDDGSTDGTAAAVGKAHSWVRVLRHRSPLGFSAAANRGLNAARGELLWLLNSDTEVEPESLCELVRAFDDHPTLGIIGAQLFYPDGSPQWSGGAAPSLSWLTALASGLPPLLSRVPSWRRVRPLTSSSPRRVDWVTGAALALRREVWQTCGPLDERYQFYAQDLDFCLVTRRAGWEVAVLPSIRVRHHHGATIARDSGCHTGRQQPVLLWTDLVRWARKHRGPAWASQARRALALGGSLRVLVRSCLTPLVLPFLDPPGRKAWRRDTSVLCRALRSLRSL